jgi:hypothetical protein
MRAARSTPLPLHRVEQRLLFGGQNHALARQRGAHAGAAAADLGKFGVGQALSVGHGSSVCLI